MTVLDNKPLTNANINKNDEDIIFIREIEIILLMEPVIRGFQYIGELYRGSDMGPA